MRGIALTILLVWWSYMSIETMKEFPEKITTATERGMAFVTIVLAAAAIACIVMGF